jgi:hypothetical protein
MFQFCIAFKLKSKQICFSFYIQSHARFQFNKKKLIQAAHSICGFFPLFIHGITYSRSKKMYQNLQFAVFPSLIGGFLKKSGIQMMQVWISYEIQCSLIICGIIREICTLIFCLLIFIFQKIMIH